MKTLSIGSEVLLKTPGASTSSNISVPELTGMIPTNNIHFFTVDQIFRGSKDIAGPEKEARISESHEITPAKEGLGVRSIVLIRDYEADSHEKGAAAESKAGKLAAKEHDAKEKLAHDTLHILAIADSSMKEIQKNWLRSNMKNGTDLFAIDDKGVERRQSILELFKASTTSKTHKVLKGPFWNTKTAFVQNPEEEWGAGIKAPAEGVRYKDPIVFFDIEKAKGAGAKSVFVLLYADDSGSWLFGRPWADPLGDRDDLVGVFEVSLDEIQERKKLFLKQPRAVLREGKSSIDFILELEPFDSTRHDIVESLKFHKPLTH